MENRLLSTALLLCLSAAATAVVGEDVVQVQLSQGVIEGVKTDVGEGRSFYSFKSIPFAEPPVGELRFRDPVAAGPWTGVRNGSEATPLCPQLLMYTVLGQEDCLYLSVYTPRPFESDLPVMVWIHGGSFTTGFSEQHQPLPLLNKDVVLVVIQYRLSTLGFLSTEDSELPGNVGLKDQAMALRWVKDNIHGLGGDPEKVTLFGWNAGAVSVHHHILSPVSRGLFSGAIMQSGSALSPWSLREDHAFVATKLGEHFNCSQTQEMNSTALVACLQQVPLNDLVWAETKFIEWTMSTMVMVPRVDGHFLPSHPASLIREGNYNRVNVMMGTTKDEGALTAQGILKDPAVINSLLENFSSLGPVFLLFLPWDDTPEYLARRAFYRYMGEMAFEMEKIDQFVQLFSDDIYSVPVLQAVEQDVRDAAFGFPVYTYELQHRGEYSIADLQGPPPEWALNYVGHGDDVQYLFPSIMMNFTMSKDEDLFVSQIMVDLWTNFAATGTPTPDLSLGFKWTPTSLSEFSYLAITPAPMMEAYHKEQDMDFWKSLPRKTNKLLYQELF